MAVEPADVLIIGAGASGGVVGKRLAEAGFKVVCLEQGDWHNRDDYPGNKLDWELHQRKSWATSPNIRGLATGLPHRRGRHARVAAHVQRGRRLDAHLRRRLATRPAQRLPSAEPRRDRRRLADRLLRAAALLLSDRPRLRRQRPARRPGLSAGPRGRADAATADRCGRAQDRPRSHQARLALVAGVQLDQLHALRRPPAVRPTQHLPVGLQRGRQGLDRPDPLAQGDRQRRPARHRCPRPTHRDQRRRPGDRRHVDRPRRQRAFRAGQGRGRGRERDRHSPAAAAVGQRAHPDGLANSSGSGRQAADDASVRQRRRPVRGAADELAGPVRRPDRVARVLRDRREAWFRPRRPLGPRADGRADQHGAPQSRRRADLGPDHHLHVKSTVLGHGANWGLFAEDLPDEANRVTLSLDGHRRDRASRRRRSTTRWPTTRGGCSTSTSSAPRSRWTPPARTRSRSTG